MSVKTSMIVVCDAHCGREASVREYGGRLDMPPTWATVRSDRGPSPGKDMHLCPRCFSIAIQAVLSDKVRAAVCAAVEIKEVT